jgi:glycosyltransferase involved in cell wall biosynthesis
MNIAIIGPGLMSIPPLSWGAVEILIWDYYTYLINLGHNVKIYNTRDLQSIKDDISKNNYDFIHLHYDDYLGFFEDLNHKNFAVTSHYGNLPREQFYESYYWKIFKNFINTKHKIFALSNEIKDMYVKYGKNANDIVVMPNGVDVNKFCFNKEAVIKDRTIYFGRLEKRKGQHLYSNKEGFNLDFVGNIGDIQLELSKDNRYLGTWDKNKVYNNLTDYANMALISYSEAHPLVCIEALSAGLGVVVSKAAAANLDESLDFISVIPDNRTTDFEYVKQVIKENRLISINKREEIRSYALKNFDWNVIIKKYLENI